MTFWLIASTLALFFSLGVLYWIHSLRHSPLVVKPIAPPNPPAPLISVIIPVRNEERNIRRCLESMFRQTYPNLEVIVVNDRSSDRTPQILEELAQEDSRLQVIQGSPLPEGWAGKPHALWQGSKAARGEWLCFIDADTFATPELIASVYAAARANGSDLFSLLTAQKLDTFWEKTLQPLVFTALMVGFRPHKVNDPRQPDAIANGAFLFFHRAAYEAIGGHQSVADSIVEDRDLAKRIKNAGLRLLIADGRGVMTTRMYTSFSEIWEGWTKNMFLGLHDHPRLAALGVFGGILGLMGALVMPAWLIAGIIWLVKGGGAYAALVVLQAVTAWIYLLYWRIQVNHEMEVSPWYAFTFPIGSFVFAAMLITSALKVTSGKGVTWKGRRYMARPEKQA